MTSSQKLRDALEALCGLGHFEIDTTYVVDDEDQERLDAVEFAVRWIDANINEIISSAELDKRI